LSVLYSLFRFYARTGTFRDKDFSVESIAKQQSHHNGIVKSILRRIMETITRLFTQPAESFFLFGSRGTGKSTFMGNASRQDD
jgi:predicted AAA+ superfamily ATPase